MQFMCLLPVRDEADIVGQCLKHLLRWADQVFVFDTGSVDETWEIVQGHARADSRVVPIRKDSVYFSETRLRGWMFHHARRHMKTGDWFLRVDADEFHHITPPEFVKTRLERDETIVYHQYYNFSLRQSEVEDWEMGRETLADRDRPIEQRRQWYEVSRYAEPRLCRYRESMKWPPTVSFPYNAGFVAKERLPIRHYPHRDPMQLARRCRLRTIMLSDPTLAVGSFRHWENEDWRSFVVPDNSPNLLHWQLGTPFREVKQFNHLAAFHKRFAQRIVHRFLLPLLDARRPSWSEGDYPRRIPREVIARLDDELGTGLSK